MIGDLLATRLQKIIKKNVKKNSISKEVIDRVLSEIEISLIESDVNVKVVQKLLISVKEKSKIILKEKKLSPSQTMIKLVYQEIKLILGDKTSEISCKKNPTIIMMVGLQGSGKTTTSAKIAKFLEKQKSKKPLLVACDIYRPGAIDQLKQLGQQHNIPVFEKGKTNPVSIAQKAIKYAKSNKRNLIIIDTAGRLQINKELMDELKAIRNKVSPQEILLVVDGMVGQDAINQVEVFNKELKLTGAVPTKLDSDTKGGAVLSITYLTKIPIKFIGTGETIKNLQLFHPDRTAQRIMGMGDIKTLFETATDVLDERTMKITMQRMMRGQFDLQDFLNQLKQIKKMGNLQKLARMMPGLPKISDAKIEDAQRKLKMAEILISSMTVKERQQIKYLKHLSRKKRIINGSGRSEKEYNELLNHYQKSKKQVDLMSKNIKQNKGFNMSNFGGLN